MEKKIMKIIKLMLCAKKEKINSAYVLKHNSTCEKQFFF